MKYYLDTNILVFLLQKDLDEIAAETQDIIDDCANILMTSTVCVQELIHLCQIGKIFGTKKKKNVVGAESILPCLQDMGIEIVPVERRHLAKLAELPLHVGHTDPADRLIVAQAIADRAPLVSSDRKFPLYVPDGLDFVRNVR